MWNIALNTLRQLHAQAEQDFNDAQLAAAVLEVLEDRPLTGEVSRDEHAAHLAHLLTWWLFVRAPALRPSYLVLSAMSLDLVLEGARSLTEVIDDLSTLEQAALEEVESERDLIIDEALRDALNAHGELPHDLTEQADDALRTSVRAATAATSEHAAARDALTQQVMDRLLDEFDAVGKSGSLRAAFEGEASDVEEFERAADYAQRGFARQESGELDGALRDHMRALTLDAEHIPALIGVATVHAALGELDEAIKALDRALALDAEHLDALQNRGLVHYARHDFSLAIDDFSRALALDPEDLSARLNRASALGECSRFEEALKDLDEAAAAHPEESRPLVDRAVIHRAMGDVKGAIKAFDAALAIDPNDPNAWSGRGFLRLELGEPQRAEHDLGEAIRLEPWRALLHYNRGNARGAQGNMPGAIEDYSRAIMLDDRDVEALINRGTARLKLDDLKGALEDWDHALRIDPYQPDAHLKRGAVLLMNDEPEYAILDFERALQIAPDEWDFADTTRAQLKEARRRIEAAAKKD